MESGLQPEIRNTKKGAERKFGAVNANLTPPTFLLLNDETDFPPPTLSTQLTYKLQSQQDFQGKPQSASLPSGGVMLSQH